MQTAHHLNVQWLQGVAGGLDEVDTGVHTVVNNVHAVDLVLGVEVGIEPLLDVLDNGTPRVVVVDEVSESGGVNDGQTQTDAVLLDVCTDGLDRDGLGDDVQAGASTFSWGI